MKKTLHITLAFLALGSCALSGATVLFSDNFESGDFTSPSGQSASWVTTNQPLNGELSVSTNGAISGTYSAYMNTPTGSGEKGTLVGVYADSETFGSNVSASLNIAATNAASFSGYFALRDVLANVVRIRFIQSSGNIQYESVPNSWVTIQPYTSGSTYNITLDLDFTTDTYNIAVNGTPSVSGVAMLTNTDGINRFSLSGGLVAASTGSFRLDDLQIMETTAIPEPSSMAALAGLAVLGFCAIRRRSLAIPDRR